jgi:lysophospholipase L1-like esterase
MTRSNLRRNARVALVGLLMVTMAGCFSGGPSKNAARADQPRRTSVVVVGDSIAEGSRQDLQDALAVAGFTEVVIEAVSGRRIAIGNGTTEPLAGVDTLRNVVGFGAQPDVWVFALGSNDVGKYAQAEYESLLDSMIDQIPGGAPLVWVDVYVEHNPEGTAQFNELVRDRLGKRGHATVASWFQFASDPGSAVLQDDRLHPNVAGRKRFATLVTEAAIATR